MVLWRSGSPSHSGPWIQRTGLLFSAIMLVNTEYVAAGIAKTRGDFWSVSADRLCDFAAIRDDGCDRRGHIVNHDVHHQARSRGWRAIQNPRATYFADAIVE